MKHMILSLTLLLSTLALATTVETNLTVIQETSTRTISKKIQLAQGQDRVVYEENGLRVEVVIVNRTETQAELQCSVYSIKKDGTQELLSSPVLLAEYGKPAQISLGDSNGNSLSLEVIVTKE